MEEVVIHPPEPPIGTLELIHIGFASHILGEDDGQFWARRIDRTASGEGRAEWRMPCASVKIGTSVGSLRIAQLERLDIHVEVRSYYLEMENCLSSLTCATAPGASNSPCSPTGT